MSVEDAEGQTVYSQELPLSAYGSFAGELQTYAVDAARKLYRACGDRRGGRAPGGRDGSFDDTVRLISVSMSRSPRARSLVSLRSACP